MNANIGTKQLCQVGLIGLGCVLSSPALGNSGIIVSARDTAGAESDIFWLDTTTGDHTNITGDLPRDCGEPQISPDGTRVAFMNKDTNGYRQLWVMGRDGSNKVQLTDVQHQYGPVCWPWLDDHRIMYRYAPGPSIGDIRTIDVDSLVDELLFGSNELGQGSIDHVSISKDRESLALAAQSGSWSPSLDLYSVNLQTAESVLLTQDNPDTTSDHRSVYLGGGVVMWQRSSQPGVGANEFELRSVRSRGGGDVVELGVADFGSMRILASSPDGGSVLYTDSTDGLLYTYTASTGQANLLPNAAFADVSSADWVADVEVSNACGPADFNEDGVVDIFDVFAYLSIFNTGCP